MAAGRYSIKKAEEDFERTRNLILNDQIASIH